MNILYFYDSTQTFTNTVYEHISSFARYSNHRSFFCHQEKLTELNLDLSLFDAVGIHFSIRLPFDQIAPTTCKALQEFDGLKFLFIQDEYDHTHRAWYWIKHLGIGLVFTVVPEQSIARIYPPHEFNGTRFVSNLTGYVPDTLVAFKGLQPPSSRPLFVGYRGRPLSIRYGKLGQEKMDIGKQFKAYCDSLRIHCDIAWTEKARIYGPRWYEFITSCRAMLGSESGSNVFDWDGSLVNKITRYRETHKTASDEEVYDKFVRPAEMDGVMNQVSPRVFEAIAAKTVLVLYEGEYSGVVREGEHFISLKKDGSNLADVIAMLKDDAYVDMMAERAYQDIIASGRYSYRAFVEMVNSEIDRSFDDIGRGGSSQRMTDRKLGSPVGFVPTEITTRPIVTRPIVAVPAVVVRPKEKIKNWARKIVYKLWGCLSEQHRAVLKPRLKKLLKLG